MQFIKKLLLKIEKSLKLKYLNYKYKKSTKYTIGYILSIIPKDQIVRRAGKSKKRKGKYIIFNGIKIRCYSRKFYFFQEQYTRNKMIVCPICGLRADYFRVVPTGSFDSNMNAHYTFNLFGVKDNQQILFDLDHIYPVAKGGKNEKNNLRILCHYCNNSKADFLK